MIAGYHTLPTISFCCLPCHPPSFPCFCSYPYPPHLLSVRIPPAQQTSSFASLRRPSFGPNNLLSRRRVHRRGQLRTQTYARARNCLVRLSFSVCTPLLSPSHHTDLSYSHSAFFSFHGVCLFLTFSHRVLSRVHTHRPDTRSVHSRAIKPSPPSSPSRSSQATSLVHLCR